MDDLNTPLTGPPAARPRFRLSVTPAQVIAGVLALFLAVVVGWAVIGDDPWGGEPLTKTALRSPGGAQSAANDAGDAGMTANGAPGHPHPNGESSADAQSSTSPAAPAGAKTVTIIDGSSGKQQHVILPGTQGPKVAAGIDKRLLEGTRHGLIPKVGPNGLRPVEAYAHKAGKAAKGRPQIAIVIRGLGISASGTADALSRLPGAVTLAFAPYGANLGSLTAQARALGHELLIETPMEPFNYPDNDPGPQTLLTSASSAQNIDRLHWVMSRFQGYVGLTGEMGARFVVSESAMAPVMADIAKRGLLYFDDSSSDRSVAAKLARADRMPFAQSDEVLDRVPSAQAIDHALLHLELLARKRGTAVASASALPVTIDRIVRWAKQAAAHGIVLVPLTTIALKSKSS